MKESAASVTFDLGAQNLKVISCTSLVPFLSFLPVASVACLRDQGFDRRNFFFVLYSFCDDWGCLFGFLPLLEKLH